jgi:hypothetical protein
VLLTRASISATRSVTGSACCGGDGRRRHRASLHGRRQRHVSRRRSPARPIGARDSKPVTSGSRLHLRRFMLRRSHQSPLPPLRCAHRQRGILGFAGGVGSGAGGCRLPNGNLTVVYDELGSKYEIPPYCLSEPSNLIDEVPPSPPRQPATS